MPRLIDADKLITTIQGTESEVARNAPYDAEWFTRMADRQFEILKMIDDAPTEDVVEVVRCKDCISGKGSTHKACPLYKQGLMKDDDYCSVGERKDND